MVDGRDRLGVVMTDTTALIVLVALVLWVVCAVGAYLIAGQKGDPNPGVWGVIGFLLGPIGLVLAAVMAKPATAPAAPAREDRTARIVITVIVLGTVVVAVGGFGLLVLLR